MGTNWGKRLKLGGVRGGAEGDSKTKRGLEDSELVNR